MIHRVVRVICITFDASVRSRGEKEEGMYVLTFGFRGSEPGSSYLELDEIRTFLEYMRQSSLRKQRRSPKCELFEMFRVAENLEKIGVRNAVSTKLRLSTMKRQQ